jgi:signal transduction histidine kinase
VVAHDLRAPVGVTRSLLEIADDEWSTMTTDELRELVGRARNRLDSLARFVDDLFDAVRLDTGDLQISTEPVDDRKLVEQVVDDVRVSEPDRRVEVHGPEAIEASGDPLRTWQIITNLVSNALKFSPPDTTVHISLRRDAATVSVEVADAGPGVPEEQRELLFGRFARLPTSATTPGAGLGLFIARSLAEAQGGDLQLARAAPGTGATFVLTLPAGAPA